MKLVTVVIPCFNSGATLPQTVESVKAQSYENIEIIIVDDGSNDALTITAIDRLSGVRVIRQKNAGLPAARNIGFSEARGEYVLPLDADDWLETDAVAQLAATLETNQQFAFVFSHIQLEGESSGVLKKSYNFFEQLFSNQIPYAILIRRAIWEDIGGYDETMRKGYEDWEFNIRLGGSGHYGAVVPKPLFHYRVASTGMLLAQSNQLHGELWSDIQCRNETTYRMFSLLKLWRVWRLKACTYPLLLYFFWLAIHHILPQKIFAFLFRSLRAHSHSHRVTRRVIKAFGEEWERFDQQSLLQEERKKIFADYFSIFPWSELPDGAKGADVGCGSGRWAVEVASRVGWLTCIDASPNALNVARANLVKNENVDFKLASVEDLPFDDGELDFAYTLGVLHHVVDMEGGLRSIARTIRPGGIFLIYLYYAFDHRPLWFKLIWRFSELLRGMISRMKPGLRFIVCESIALLVYWPLAKFASLCGGMRIPLKHFPLSYYADKSFYVMRTDALDRFGTELEKRYTKSAIIDLLKASGFEKISFSNAAPFWCAVATKSDDV